MQLQVFLVKKNKKTHLGNKLCHKLNHGWIISKLPNKHGHLLHGDTTLIIPFKDIMDQLILELLVLIANSVCVV